ncbi:histidine kinase N-terminal 7TM domain-containing protein [Pseudobacteroides cellulosolvens]|uniref:ATP-binding region ATPase domain protein n=1 Tax=Pseudobacteroides cellulosolvens ATCC 35603 = DSM 2933 TaxID=398512 RepID=A0A0L6JJ56_9FIRM|nr:histidine kinase N-terminal 7TM domain-containing protein [Pseudobacteroides cellulosolvens]KNY25779.1 ATP-binding region ATPase domain protein [Pseudobacteroides cellulosolvens ATCC 35603 = DSM 2933]
MAIVKTLVYFVSCCILIVFIKSIWFNKNQKQIYKFCLLNVLLAFFWTILSFINESIRYLTGHYIFAVFFLSTTCTYFLPSAALILSIIIAKDRISLKSMFLFSFPPIVFTLLHAANSYHSLIYKSYDNLNNTMTGMGPLFIIYAAYQFVYTMFSVIYIMKFSLKHTNGLSKQILLFVAGILAPIVFSSFSLLKRYLPETSPFPSYYVVFIYLFFAFCITYSIKKYRFLDIIPIALQNVVDNMSDPFIVTDLNGNIIDKNKIFVDLFGKEAIKKKSNHFFDYLKNMNITNIHHSNPNIMEKQFFNLIDKMEYYFSLTKTKKIIINMECAVTIGTQNKDFKIEIKPILVQDRFLAILIMFKDITEHKQILKLMEENTNQLIEKARLLSLNQLIGGIAHNIKTPLMSSSGGILALTRYTERLDELLKDEDIYIKHPEFNNVLKDMLQWEKMIKQYLLYISDVITAVKDQSVSLNSSKTNKFTIAEVVEKINLLMSYEFKRKNCKFNVYFSIDPQTQIIGDIVVLTQILNNVIMNSIQAYEDGGEIQLTVCKDKNDIVFVVRDYGKGISDDVKQKLFNQMVTTKGKDGTGLGLYISNIALHGSFNGTMGLQPNIDRGTGIFISIPIKI